MPEAFPPVFRRAVIALSGGSFDSTIVRLALDVSRQTHAELIAVHVVELDWTQPLDAEVAERSEEAQRVLDAAEGIAEAMHCKLESVLVQARDVGAAIVDETCARDADNQTGRVAADFTGRPLAGTRTANGAMLKS